jgi:hypothetical protein
MKYSADTIAAEVSRKKINAMNLTCYIHIVGV